MTITAAPAAAAPISWCDFQKSADCADIIKGYDSVFHRYGICDHDDCTICDAEDDEKHRSGECTDNCTVCRWEREANTQRVAYLGEDAP
jgi:hypothetical protein